MFAVWLACLVLLASQLLGCHAVCSFRHGLLTWERGSSSAAPAPGTQVWFRLWVGWSGGCDSSGGTLGGSGSFDFGDGAVVDTSGVSNCTWASRVLGFWQVDCYFNHTYYNNASPAVYLAQYTTCCRLPSGGLQNNANTSVAISSVVVVDPAYRQSLQSGYVPLDTVLVHAAGADSAAIQQRFAAFDPSGYVLQFQHSDSASMSGAASATQAPLTPPLPSWSVSASTGVVTWANASALLLQGGLLYSAQLRVAETASRRTLSYDILYQVQAMPKYCLSGSSSQASCGSQVTCVADSDCGGVAGICVATTTPAFVAPTPKNGSVNLLFATQSITLAIASTFAAPPPSCCLSSSPASSALVYVEGPQPLGFQRVGNVTGGTSSFTAVYSWTPTVAQEGLHQLCWSVCALCNSSSSSSSNFTLCSPAHCFALYVSLAVNTPPTIHLPAPTGGAADGEPARRSSPAKPAAPALPDPPAPLQQQALVDHPR